ncbi:MAG: tRNA uridine(34) 5-carboxymethylaminomethyl modification radical SAM/GNAT enzyme Elp3 [Candidatus Parvarchaeota archaeon]|nr:tRNA uridine(34) 5-carboxymethylaminomethyl modification radical SAM/GNAT enzyme Elp3 [Candidatus Jingweiarchaeum tengchongense]MCW1298563.1 tRNA uridine(34) 5-carboxymethylaminomethyl modification radical SAM/GNAT enzyme Elp3 [Candidatus Jingweiarchaeum tengchongense]MCW1304586.1 tRNA uridine(34) 5-carboxymethylaminomethyl modification radical SAM/GNAT enzyme Elp3 [Candidatus Jingweiarchaeum tengchongense]MCW1309177.1 tRNA uridine(34) 5-carboxymethylaminomethyl modification radical SAM/GNAT 
MDSLREKVIDIILEEIKNGSIKSKEELLRRKKDLAREFNLEKIPTNTEIFLASGKDVKLRELLKIKPVRTTSGVAVVAVMTRPFPCPHGNCIYCPSVDGIPKSYTGKEPATMRAIRNKFDPFLQVTDRLNQYFLTGHFPQKVELVVMGGTFTSFPDKYQENFIKNCFLAMNFFGRKRLNRNFTLRQAQKMNENARIRCVALVFETRPDYSKEKQVDNMLRLGGTRVELGVQSVYEDVLKKIGRKHGIDDVIEATRILKDSGFKVDYHVMLGLPGSNKERDKRMFDILFENPSFRPDGLKIYPTLIVKGSELYEHWKYGKYKAIDDDYVIDLLSDVKARIPIYVRIKRIMRDISAKAIEAGPRKSNIRELIRKKMKEKKLKCRCIRCREIGHRLMEEKIEFNPDDFELCRYDYEASEGKEIFLSYEDKKNDALVGFLRLRKVSDKAHRKEIKGKNTMIVRELHVYGTMVPIGRRIKEAFQHKGYGAKLLKEAEKIAKKDFNADKLLILSGIGAKVYYKKLGYGYDGVYLSKKL